MRWVALGGIVLAAMLGLARGAQAQDPSAERVFRSQYGRCHSPQPCGTIIGPRLFGVVGRHSGIVPGFRYCEANWHSGLTRDAATLDRHLAAPGKVVPGTLMTCPGLKDPKQRAGLIAYLSTLR
jgi:cytochrome c